MRRNPFSAKVSSQVPQRAYSVVLEELESRLLLSAASLRQLSASPPPEPADSPIVETDTQDRVENETEASNAPESNADVDSGSQRLSADAPDTASDNPQSTRNSSAEDLEDPGAETLGIPIEDDLAKPDETIQDPPRDQLGTKAQDKDSNHGAISLVFRVRLIPIRLAVIQPTPVLIEPREVVVDQVAEPLDVPVTKPEPVAKPAPVTVNHSADARVNDRVVIDVLQPSGLTIRNEPVGTTTTVTPEPEPVPEPEPIPKPAPEPLPDSDPPNTSGDPDLNADPAGIIDILRSVGVDIEPANIDSQNTTANRGTGLDAISTQTDVRPVRERDDRGETEEDREHANPESDSETPTQHSTQQPTGDKATNGDDGTAQGTDQLVHPESDRGNVDEHQGGSDQHPELGPQREPAGPNRQDDARSQPEENLLLQENPIKGEQETSSDSDPFGLASLEDPMDDQHLAQLGLEAEQQDQNRRKTNDLITAGVVAATLGKPINRLVFTSPTDDPENQRPTRSTWSRPTGRRRRRSFLGNSRPRLPEDHPDEELDVEDIIVDLASLRRRSGRDLPTHRQSDAGSAQTMLWASSARLLPQQRSGAERSAAWMDGRLASALDAGAMAAVLSWLFNGGPRTTQTRPAVEPSQVVAGGRTTVARG